MHVDERTDLLVSDVWEELPAQLRDEFVTRRAASTGSGWGTNPRQKADSRRWEPLRPVVIDESAYRGLEFLAARLLRLAVDACRRRASTLGELYRVLRFPHALPLMDPDRPLRAAELIRYARPDLLLEHGRPRLLETNNSTRLGGTVVTPELAEAYAALCPQSGLHPPPSSVTARAAALARTLRAGTAGNGNGNGHGGRLLLPLYWGMDNPRTCQRFATASKPLLADLRRLGVDVVEADLAELRVDAAGRLLATDVPIDLVLLEWGGNRIVNDRGGFDALRAADRAGTVQLFPRTETAILSSKAVLAWLHEDCDAGLLSAADQALVRTHVPWTACLGLDGDPAAEEELLRRTTGERDLLVAKPAVGNSGRAVVFGDRLSDQEWSDLLSSAAESPLVLQRRVRSDRVAIPFRDQDSGRQVEVQVPFVLSPYMIDGAAASVAVRHMGPGVPDGDVVISASRGAYQSTAVLAPA
ncbi:hypothetical protein ACI789_04725 [Geodermatophilus sp. SYSU D00965]